MWKYFESPLMRLYATGILMITASIVLSQNGTFAGALAFLGIATTMTAFALALFHYLNDI